MKNFWLTPFLSSFIERRGTAPIVGVNLRWRIFFVLYFGALRPQTPGSTFPTVELEKSREKSPLKKFFSHTFRLLIYGEQPHPPTPSPNREGEKVPLCEERDLGWGYFNAIWQMKNFWLTPFFVLLHLKEGTAPIVGVNLRWRIYLQQSGEWKNFGCYLFYWIIIYYLYLLFV